MIDAIFKFTDLATAKADPVVQKYMNMVTQQFRLDRVLPGLQVWRASQDVIGTDADGNPMVTHTMLAGWFAMISVDLAPAQIPSDIKNHPALQFACDRDMTNSRTPGMVLKSNVSNAVMQDIRFSPVFSGMNPPWGNWT